MTIPEHIVEGVYDHLCRINGEWQPIGPNDIKEVLTAAAPHLAAVRVKGDDLVERVARAWASIDGKSGLFDECKASKAMEDQNGTYEGYMAEARELIKRAALEPSTARETDWQAIIDRPIVGIENRTPQEVHDILRDRIKHALSAPSAARELHGPFGYIVGRRDLREDEWSLENDPVNEEDAANGFFSVPLYALTDPFKEIGIDGRSNAASPSARELALEEVTLERSIERWRGMKPSEVMKGSAAQITYALEDARKDILSLARALSSPDHADAGKVEGDGSRWRIFEAACARGYWGIEFEQASNDDEPILYPIKVHRDTLVRIVEAHNAAIPSAPSEGAE